MRNQFQLIITYLRLNRLEIIYKHWTEPFTMRRVIVSFGFILPYSDLGTSDSDYRVRLSKRIIKYFQN